MVKIIIGIVICAVIVIGGLIILNNPMSTTADETVETTDTFSYTIEGEVKKEGTYLLQENITMADLIEAAGGVSSNADARSYYEDVTLTSGTTYYIAGTYDSSDVCGSSAITKVNINTDAADDLASVNGISSTVANSIVSYRTQNGNYKTLEDLLKVYGIGNATYRKIRSYVILHD